VDRKIPVSLRAAARRALSHLTAVAARREVEGRFPAWRSEREYFHAEGRRLKGTLRALLG
jgi:hypothetical protein